MTWFLFIYRSSYSPVLSASLGGELGSYLSFFLQGLSQCLEHDRPFIVEWKKM